MYDYVFIKDLKQIYNHGSSIPSIRSRDNVDAVTLKFRETPTAKRIDID